MVFFAICQVFCGRLCRSLPALSLIMLSLFPTFVSSQEISKVQKVSVNIGSGVSVGANALRIIGGVDGNISYYGADGPVRSQTVI